MIPDLTLFVYTDESVRQKRITDRGKSELDKVLNNNKKRLLFLKEFKRLLNEKNRMYVNNFINNLDETIKDDEAKILTYKREIRK